MHHLGPILFLALWPTTLPTCLASSQSISCTCIAKCSCSFAFAALNWCMTCVGLDINDVKYLRHAESGVFCAHPFLFISRRASRPTRLTSTTRFYRLARSSAGHRDPVIANQSSVNDGTEIGFRLQIRNHRRLMQSLGLQHRLRDTLLQSIK